MIKVIALLCVLGLTSSCSYFTNKFESITNTNRVPNNRSNSESKKKFCPTPSKFQYISEDELAQKYYKTLHPIVFENKTFSFIEKAIIISIIEMIRRPGDSSPYSRLQVYLKLDNKPYYFDFYPKNFSDENKMPQLFGLDYLSKRFSKKGLKNIFQLLDKLLPKTLSVSSEHEKFLLLNQQELSKNEEYVESFFKGDEVLTRYETFNRPNFSNVYDFYSNPVHSKSEDYIVDGPELPEIKTQSNLFRTNCNYDLASESNSRDVFPTTEEEKSHYFALSEGDNYFLAVASGSPERPFKTDPKFSYFLKVEPSKQPLPICEFKGPNQEIILFSSSGRKPAQHLQHLVAYEIDQIDSSDSLNILLNFSRHLFLTTPDRILYESKRGRKAQLDFFLAMNFPIYHVESLGNIFGHAIFRKGLQHSSSLHIDDRSNAKLWCGQ